MVLIQHFTPTHYNAAGDIFGVASSCHSYNKPFIVVVFHEESNGRLVRWKLHVSFFPSRTLSVLS